MRTVVIAIPSEATIAEIVTATAVANGAAIVVNNAEKVTLNKKKKSKK